ncbi:methyltransferase type 11 [Laribacter hongkongensis HLHK9]|uniref:Methyltransferase type 11 n=1 Tax=Laribacter hongkongensis (strain HLHK9) TaxID=557598 RepID=C1D941_LARHH|nr:class I SAM-dependent methyltransferase [Laribacter hongkongensis]ACO74981.1 methyltransferase type 11 [Laribacter hongkongensis HLHK9]
MKISDYVWEEIWRKDPYSNSAERESRAKMRIQRIKEIMPKDGNLGRVIELGCGDGSFAKALLSDKSMCIESYLGLDKSTTAISKARGKLNNCKRVTFKCTDIHDVDEGEIKFNTVIACGLLEHICDIEKALLTIKKLCALDGLVIMTMSNTLSAMYIDRKIKERLGSWRYGYQRNYRPEEWRSLLENDFHAMVVKVFQADWDNKVVAVIDRFGSIFNKQIGRYIIASAAPKW